MVATHQDSMSNYNNSPLEMDDVQTPARYIALLSILNLKEKKETSCSTLECTMSCTAKSSIY